MTKLRFGTKMAVYLVLSLGAVSMLVPFLWMLSTSVKQPNEVFSSTGEIEWLPKHFLWKDSMVNSDGQPTPDVCAEDIQDAASLASKLKAQKDPVSKLVFSSLTANAQKLLGSYPGKGEPSPSLRQAMITGLNKVIEGKPAFDKTWFTQVTAIEENKALASADRKGDTDKQLNRMFVQDAFLDELARAQRVRAWWGNYPDAWKEINLLRLYLNSIFIAVVATFGQVLTSSMAAYAFARLQFPGRDKLFFAYLATMMIPGSVTMIPVFVILRYMGWINSYPALIIPGMFSAYGTFMLRQFFMGLPSELEDAAKIDGAGYTGIFAQVIIPLSKPALATLTTFTFMGVWGSYMWPLIVTITEEMRTLPIGLKYFVGMHATNYTQLMAGSMIALIPVLILFIFNQRYFVEGIKLSGLGGR